MKRIAFALAVLLVGCGVTQGGRQENHQNIGAGGLLKTNPDPSVAAIGADVEANSTALEAEIGAPKNPLPYTRENSAAARNQQESELAARQAWKDLLDQALGAATAALGLGAIWGWLRSVKLGKVVESVVDGVESLVQAHPEAAKLAKAAISKTSLEGGVADALKSLVVKHTD